MSDVNEQIIVTEKEAIEITMHHGYDGEEFETVKWKKNGSLDPTSGTFAKLVSKLETIYDSVQWEGKGKKRRYTLADKKDEVTKRETKYKGTVPKDEDILMQEYIFNKLLTMKWCEYSYTGWLNELGFPNMIQYDIPAMKEEIKTWYRDQYYMNGLPYDSGEVSYKFTEELYTRSKAVFENTLNRLQKEGRISFSYKYMGKESTEHNVKNYNDISDIDEITYIEFIEMEKDMVEGYDVEYRAYKRQLISPRPFTKKYQKIHNEVQPALEEATGLEYVYYLIRVEVLGSDKQVEEITDAQFTEAYFKRFVVLMAQRQNNSKYKDNLDYHWKRFFYFNTMILIDMCFDEPFETFKNLLQEAKENHLDEVNNFIMDYLIHQEVINSDGEVLVADIKKQERHKRRHTFGEIK